MIIHDDSWHQRMADSADIAANDPTIETRLKFYINLLMTNSKSHAAPRANARGILVNVMGLLEEEAEQELSYDR